MPLSPIVIAELRRELDALIAQRSQLDQKIDAIRRLIGDGDQQGGSEASAVLATLKPMDIGTWKGLVKSLLREHPGVKAATLTQILRERGISPGGATRLSHRVYNELWRMYKSGEARKVEGGGFVLNE